MEKVKVMLTKLTKNILIVIVNCLLSCWDRPFF
jgi:hypothetical protein